MGLVLAGALALPAVAFATDPGEQLYLRHCGSCHGPKGRGDGIAAPFITPRPPDLTAIAQRNEGVFPYASVLMKLDGRERVPAHGSREMPIWGERFGESIPESSLSEEVTRGRVVTLVEYLKSIQRRN